MKRVRSEGRRKGLGNGGRVKQKDGMTNPIPRRLAKWGAGSGHWPKAPKGKWGVGDGGIHWCAAQGGRIGENGVESKGGQKRKKIRKKGVTAAWAEPEPAVGGLVFFPEKARPGSLESRPREGRGRKWEVGDSSGKWAPGHGSKKWGKRRSAFGARGSPRRAQRRLGFSPRKGAVIFNHGPRRTEEGKDQKGPGIGGRGGARARRRQSRLLPRKIRSGSLGSRPREGRGRESWEWAMQV